MVKSLQAGMDTLKADVEAYDALTAKTVELLRHGMNQPMQIRLSRSMRNI